VPAFLDCEKKTKQNLYFLAFGISKYKDSSLNLKYADKDALDLAEKFRSMKGKFADVFIKIYTNEEVTVSNIINAKSFASSAGVDDTFVLFIAGHGVYDTDKEATYYFLTHAAERNRLSATAVNFDRIEDILQGIAPRNKLFLMDTCESGELEESASKSYYAMADKIGINARAARAITVIGKEKKAAPRKFLFQKNRYIYNDLIRRSGAIVFSSSLGGEFSYESDQLKNGFFTHSVMKGLRQCGQKQRYHRNSR